MHNKVFNFTASFDALFLLCAITTFGLPTVSKSYETEFFIYVMPITYGLTHTTRVGSVFATLSVTLERFFAIVFPFKDVDVLKKWLIPSTVVFTVIYNIPKFFEVSALSYLTQIRTWIFGLRRPWSFSLSGRKMGMDFLPNGIFGVILHSARRRTETYTMASSLQKMRKRVGKH